MPHAKPNMLLIMADDIGWFDVGAYHRGMMGGLTPGWPPTLTSIRSSYVRFQADLPNEYWQSEVTHHLLGPWRPDQTNRAEILTWLDDHSRYALSVTAHQTVTGDIVVETLQNSGDSHGFPASILTDNALVYTTRFSRGRGGRNALEVFCVDTGIHQKHSRPVHPPPVTPAVAYKLLPKATPNPTKDHHYRIRHNHIDTTGTFSLRQAGYMHHIGIGRHHTGTPIVMIIDNLDIRVIDHTTGQLLRHLQVDPTCDYQPQ